MSKWGVNADIKHMLSVDTSCAPIVPWKAEGSPLDANDILEEMLVGTRSLCCHSWFEMLRVSRWTTLSVLRRCVWVFAYGRYV